MASERSDLLIVERVEIQCTSFHAGLAHHPFSLNESQGQEGLQVFFEPVGNFLYGPQNNMVNLHPTNAHSRWPVFSNNYEATCIDLELKPTIALKRSPSYAS